MHQELCYTDERDNRYVIADLFYEPGNKAIVQILHGMAEHRERYEEFVEALIKANYAVLNCDERGHGESARNAEEKGFFGDKKGWFLNVDDQFSLYKMATKVCGDIPLILFGHSMGTLVARSYLKRYEDQVSMLVMTGSPSDNPAKNIAIGIAEAMIRLRGKYYRSEFINSLCFGAYNKAVENPRTQFDWLSVNEKNVDDYIADPDCGYVFTAAGYRDLFEGIVDAYDTKGWRIRKKDMPVLFMSGEKDPCMGPIENMKKMADHMRSVGYENVSTIIMPGMRHEILHENDRALVMEKLIEFMNRL